MTGGKGHKWQPDGLLAAALEFMGINPQDITSRNAIIFKATLELEKDTIRDIRRRRAGPNTDIIALGNPDFLTAVRGETLSQLVERFKKGHQGTFPQKVCIIANRSQCRVYHYSTIFRE